jgi:hypothetical protein
MTMPLWVQIRENLPTKVCPPTFMCLIKRKIPCIPVRSPKLRHNTVSVMHNPSFSIASLLLSPEMRLHTGMAKQTRGRRKSAALVRLLVGFGWSLNIYPLDFWPVKMGHTVDSETSSTKLTCTPCKTPKPKYQKKSCPWKCYWQKLWNHIFLKCSLTNKIYVV